jgi:GGDEF domain-containing protein
MRVVNRHWFADRVSQIVERMTDSQRHALLQVEVNGPQGVEPSVHRAFAAHYGEPEALLQSTLPPRAWLTRLSAYRYRLFLPDHSRSQALMTARLIAALFEQAPVRWQDHTISLHIALGLVAITQRPGQVSEVFAEAAAACR